MANIYHKNPLIVSAGVVYDDSRDPGRLVAHAENGAVVTFYEDDAPLTEEEKARIVSFVAEAHRASEDVF